MARLADQVYRRVPVPIQTLMVSAYGFWWKRLRFGGAFAEECVAFRSRERFTTEQWMTYQDEHLRALLISAFDHVPYYSALWTRLGVSRADLDRLSTAELKALPPLEKSIARDAPESLLNDGHATRSHLVFHTSGSTGTPVRTFWLPHEIQRSLAIRESRSCGFAGVSFSMPRATFSGRIVEPDPESHGPYYRFNLAERQVYFSAFHLRPATAAAYLHALRRHHVEWITGYSNSIFQLALMVLDQNLKAPSLKAVITTSEKVIPEMREVIEKAFSTRVFEEYATVEDLFYVCECEAGRKHVNPDAGILEVVDADFRPVPPGTLGEVLATGFIRPGQPMIRYRVGDLAVLDDQPCPCGRAMPVLKEVLGRVEDTVYGPDGRRMLRFHGIFVGQAHVQEGQIVQKRLDHLVVRVVPKVGFGPADKADIIQRVQQRLTQKVNVTVEAVEQISRTKAGKFPAVICDLPHDVLERVRGVH
ncbi:MAG: phenylacetate--CoA ligase family protein [Anaerolineae bacterium]|nr:phenylacetate--CoA ligase family protein [Anaerolineae bacterium]